MMFDVFNTWLVLRPCFQISKATVTLTLMAIMPLRGCLVNPGSPNVAYSLAEKEKGKKHEKPTF